MQRTLPAEVLEKLAAVDSPTIANIIELFDVQSRVAGYTNASIRAIYPDLAPAVGYAVTATFRSACPASNSGDVYNTMGAIIEGGEQTDGPPFMAVQDLDNPPAAAMYGEVLATAMKTSGYAGLVTSGGARDYEQVKVLNLPCFATAMLVAHGYCRFEQAGVPVDIGGLRIEPGDLLHADANGIVKISQRLAPHISRFIEPFMATEEIMMSYLRSGRVNSSEAVNVMAKMKNQMAKLAEEAQSLVANDS